MEHEIARTDAGAADAVATPEPSGPVSGQSASIGPASTRLDIDLDMLSGMTESAIAHYKECIVKFATALAREASRLEEADRAEEVGKPEITMTMIVKANHLIRHPSGDDPTARIPIVIAQISALAATIVTPIFGANLHSSWQWTATITCGILALVSQAYVFFAARRK